jgi:hypothetical protein
MREALKQIVPELRAIGFRGSGQTYRKSEGDFVFVVNFQRSRWGDVFYVNLGAQPTFIPTEGGADLTRLKEYECILRRRVGEDWPLPLSDPRAAELRGQLMSTQHEFFGHAQTLRAALAAGSVDALLQDFSAGTTQMRAALHVARGALALGHGDLSRALARRGLEIAGSGATLLQAELAALLIP